MLPVLAGHFSVSRPQALPRRLVKWDMRDPRGVVQDLSSPVVGYESGKDYSRGTNFTCMATTGALFHVMCWTVICWAMVWLDNLPCALTLHAISQQIHSKTMQAIKAGKTACDPTAALAAALVYLPCPIF